MDANYQAYKNHKDIENLRRVSRIRNSGRAKDRRDLDDHEKRLIKLEETELLCRTLVAILLENKTISPERLQQVMQQIDAEDGVSDGRVTPATSEEDPTEFPEIQTW